MHNKQWFLKRIGKTIKRERLDLNTNKIVVSWRFLHSEREAIDCYLTQDKYNTFFDKKKPIMHGYKKADKIDFYSNTI